VKHAELFAGYGGLGLAVEAVFDAELAWYAEFDEAPSKIMERHWPGIPNHGDVTVVDWASVEPVDIISGGSPCQDVSAAGRRAGMNEGTRSNLWVAMREAIATIKPTYVVWENVRGAHSAGAYSAVESEEGLLGESRAAYLRATGRVVGDLAGLGYDAQWRTISAASVGAPHKRERVFVLAWRRDTVAPHGDGRRDGRWTAAPRESGRERADTPALVPTRSHGGTGPTHPVALLPTPCAQPAGNTPEDHLRKKPGRTTVTDLSILVENNLLKTGGKLLPTPTSNLGSNGGSQHPQKRRAGGHSVSIQDVAEHLLPTPRASHGDKGGPNQRDSAGHYDLPAIGNLLPTPRASRGTSTTETAYALGGERSDEGRRHGEVLLPTPKAGDGDFGLPRTSGRPPERSTHLATRLHYTDFGTYAPAIERWERITRPSPPPTELSPRGKHRLSEWFTEWMQGVPRGWICDTEGITRTDKIKAAGNGVVPQQAAAALWDMKLLIPPRIDL